jgi:hypothetical protein
LVIFSTVLGIRNIRRLPFGDTMDSEGLENQVYVTHTEIIADAKFSVPQTKFSGSWAGSGDLN